jgi:hypothetical protein
MLGCLCRHKTFVLSATCDEHQMMKDELFMYMIQRSRQIQNVYAVMQDISKSEI